MSGKFEGVLSLYKSSSTATYALGFSSLYPLFQFSDAGDGGGGGGGGRRRGRGFGGLGFVGEAAVRGRASPRDEGSLWPLGFAVEVRSRFVL